MFKFLSFGFLLIIMTSIIFVLESPDIRTSYGIVPNPNCTLVTKGANLHGHDLSNCDLRDSDLLGVNLSGANLTNTNLARDNLQGAILSGANLSGANLNNADLAGDNLQGANLSVANLSGANLSIANLAGDNLQGANLSGANLSIANLGGSNLQGAILLGANLSGANLSGANLNNADLAGANLKGAILTNPSLTNTNFGTITIQTLASSLVPGSAYTISPDPKTGLGSLTITDGGAGDENGINDGMIKISQVPHGKYVINQVAVPPGFSSLLGSTTININPLDPDQIVTFQVISTSTNLATLPPTPITSPSLSNATFNQWITSFSAIIVNNVNSSSINNVAQTPQIIVVGTQNPTAINTAINSQSSVLLNASFVPLTKGSTIINTIGLENYFLPNSTNLVSIIPTILAKVNDTAGYVAATPPLSGIIPGQQMIIPIVNSLLPSFGGLKKIDVQSSPTAKPIGEKNTEWLVAEVDNKIPASISSRGIDGTPILFVDIQHPFEESGSGFNWSNPSNHAVPPLLTLVINKVASYAIQKDSNGCPIVNGYTLSGGSWTSVGVSEISSKSISSFQCEITIQSQHLSKFAFSLQHLSSFTSSVGLPGSGNVSAGISQPPSYLAEAATQSSTTTSTSTPTPPVELTATAASTQINLHWAAPTNNGGSPITGYKIERSNNAGFTSYTTITNTGGTAATYSDAGLASGTTYTYHVSAINVIGTSSPSDTTATTVSQSITYSTTQSSTTPSEVNLLQHLAQLNPLQRFSDLFTSWLGLH